MDPSSTNNTAALKSQPPGYSFSSERYDIFQMIFVSSGELRFESPYGAQPTDRLLRPGEFLILRQGSAFRLSSARSGYAGVCYLDYEARDPRCCGGSFAVRGSHWLIELAGLMQLALSHPGTHTAENLALLGRTVAWHALEEGAPAETPDRRPVSEYWAERIRHVVCGTLYSEHSEFRRSIAAVGLSYRQLSRHFSTQTGMTIKQFQIAERIREAKRLLGTTGLSVTDVAHELHYASSQKFAAQFRKVTGMSPREYRRG